MSPMHLWDEEIDAAREQIRSEAKAFVAGFPDDGPDTGLPVERAQARRAAES